MSTLAIPAFNPLKFANKLKDAGIPDKQAEAEADALHEALTQTVSALEGKLGALENNARKDAEQLATKADLRNEIALVRKDLHSEIALVRKDIDFLRWMMGVVLGGIVVLILKAFF